MKVTGHLTFAADNLEITQIPTENFQNLTSASHLSLGETETDGKLMEEQFVRCCLVWCDKIRTMRTEISIMNKNGGDLFYLAM